MENKTSAAQIRAVRKYEKENCWRITVVLPKNYRERIKATGRSTNGFIREAIDKLLSETEKSDNI